MVPRCFCCEDIGTNGTMEVPMIIVIIIIAKTKMDVNTCSMNVTIISTVTNNNIIDDMIHRLKIVTCLSRQKLRAHVKIAMNMIKN